jgi:hypothetical protein
MPLAFALVLGMYLLLQNPYWVPSGDGEFYVAAARELAGGRGYRFNGLPIGSAPPGWPAMMALVMKVTPYFLPLKLLAMTCMIGSLMLAYRVVRRFAAPRPALGLILLTAILSHVYQASYWLISESSFCLATTASLLVAMQIKEGGREKWRVALLLVLCAATVSVRLAGLLTIMPVIGVLLDGQWRPRRSTVWVASALVAVVTTGTFVGWRIGQRVTVQELADNVGMNIPVPEDMAAEGLPPPISGSADQTAHAYQLFPRGSVGDKFLNWGHWFSFLFWQPLRAAAGSRAVATVSALVGWTLIALLSVLVFTATTRRQWIWLGTGLYSGALAMNWSVVNARYYMPIAFLITLGVFLATNELLQRAEARRGRVLPIAIRTLFVLFVGGVALCNVATYAVEVSIARQSGEKFYERYEAGVGESMIAACQYLRALPDADRPRDREIAVSQRYTNLGRSRALPTAVRQAVMLTDRAIVTPPFKSTTVSPATPTGKGIAIRRWLLGRGVRYYLWQPPISPWRVWHFRVAWLEKARTGQTAEVDESGWQLFRVNDDLTVTQIPLPERCDPVTRVPGLQAR